jgi:phosphohistidine phosphatase SixA
MEPPVITRHRRPFLAPVWLTLLAGVVAILAAVVVYRSATTTLVVLVRPVEKDIGTINDPPLSDEGEQRAQRLANMFGDKGSVGRVDAIYVSQSRRGEQTATPLADRLGKPAVVLPADDAKGMVSRVLREHEGGTVLVIGTSENVPQLLAALTRQTIAPAATDDVGTLFVVSVPTYGDSKVLRLKY